ncbi:hypothetical protein [Fuchsiella alkaliacetigena]|uniref:hypothetical protein n=1 Tax=Fuchsiella alkaliacetigena TaxID=957042 RepID=UPI00200AAF72|nr:hypothetical protein [Fuchsiella alkaliacetigena]MCK8824667.1 hypothetical protein [Fuchsiella alkaliacetigena]
MFNRNDLPKLIVILLLVIVAVIVSLFSISDLSREVQIEAPKYVELVLLKVENM